jgi:LacI family transcriptional regulator
LLYLSRIRRDYSAKMNNNITLKDIARALNLSVSTVSKSLKDSYEIGKETKKRVLEYAMEHHYTPNRMAKGLKEGKTRSIGVVVCSIDNTFVAQTLDGIYKVGADKDYQFIIMQSKESYAQEKKGIELLYSGGIDGLLISPSCETTDFSYLLGLQKSGLPIVLFDRVTDQLNTHKVMADNFQGAYDATAHLITRGYKNIAHLNTNIKLSIAVDRLYGYKKALEDHGLNYRPELVRYCDYSNADILHEDMVAAIKDYMAMDNRPDAIFTATDQITTRCLGLLIKMGYRVPLDIALIGFTNTELADVLNPALSTVQQPAFEIGKVAAEKLIALIESKRPVEDDEYETIILDTQVHVRASSI